MRYIRNHIIEYQLFALIIYLVLITITSSMKITLPIYIVLSIWPFLSSFRKMEIVPFITITISVLYLIYGLVFQDKTETLVSFLSKTYQFIAFMTFVSYMDRNSVNEIRNERKLIWLCIIVETLLGLYLLRHSSFVDISGLTRITAGRQPVGGNFSIVLAPVMFYAYFRHEDSRRSIIALSLIPAIWVFLSGTRGYMLLFILSLAPMYWDYFFSLDKKSRNKTLVACVSIAIVVFVSIYLVLSNTALLDRLSLLLRIESGTGSRGSENKIVIDFFKNTSVIYKIIGIGYGGIPANAPGYLNAVSANVTGAWSYANYADRVGVSFHNLFSNYLLLQGLVGCIEIIIIFLWGFSKLKKVYVISKNEKRCIYLYWIGFFIMNCFRWSCDCGISEMIVFAIILGMMNKNYDNYGYEE